MGVAVIQGLTTMWVSVFRRLRPWHIGCIFALFGMNCVLPEPLDPVDDTKVNYPPVIVSTDPPSTQPQTIQMTMRDFSLTAADSNLDDVLHVRYFVDYSSAVTGTPAGPIAEALIPAGNTTQRSAVTTSIACGMTRVPMGTHQLTAVVADRAFIEGTTPPIFRAVPADGYTVEVSWTVTCP